MTSEVKSSEIKESVSVSSLLVRLVVVVVVVVVYLFILLVRCSECAVIFSKIYI